MSPEKRQQLLDQMNRMIRDLTWLMSNIALQTSDLVTRDVSDSDASLHYETLVRMVYALNELKFNSMSSRNPGDMVVEMVVGRFKSDFRGSLIQRDTSSAADTTQQEPHQQPATPEDISDEPGGGGKALPHVMVGAWAAERFGARIAYGNSCPKCNEPLSFRGVSAVCETCNWTGLNAAWFK